MVMPKRVDARAQRRSLASAAIAVIDDVGLEGVRLRDVASAAQVTTGAVTHYFDGKDALLEAALSEIARRILERQDSPSTRPDDPETLVSLAAAFLPLDEVRRGEWRVWLAFWGRAIADPRLAAVHRDHYAAIVERLAARFTRAGVAAGRAVELADALIAAIDGVGTRATLEPDLWPAERQRRTLGLLLRPLFLIAHANAGDSDVEA